MPTDRPSTTAGSVPDPGRSAPVCAVDGCTRPIAIITAGLCRAHYLRQWRTGEPGPAAIGTPAPRGQACTVDGCDRPARACGLCRLHYARLRRTGTTDDPAPRRADVTYDGAHNRLLRDRGRIAAQTCDRCAAPAAHWWLAIDPSASTWRVSPEGRPYSPDPDDYRPLCKPCWERAKRTGTLDPVPCNIEGCAVTQTDNGLCDVHHWWILTYANHRAPRPFVCTVNGCDRAHDARGLCSMHYRRMRKTGTTDDPPARPTTCTVDGCDRPARERGLCTLHAARLRRTGTTDDPAPRPRQADVTYDGAHNRLHRDRGSPTDHPCDRCAAPAAHWWLAIDPSASTWRTSSEGRPYSPDPDDYQPLCKPCWTARRARPTTPCAVDGCNRARHARGLCTMHYQRQRRDAST